MNLSSYDTRFLSRAPQPECSHVTLAVTLHTCATLGPRETGFLSPPASRAPQAVTEAGVRLLSVALLIATTCREISRIPRQGLWWPVL